MEDGKITVQSVTDRPIMAAQPVSQPLPATFQKMRIQRIKALEHRDWHEEVAPGITDEPLDFAFVVALAWATEAVREQVMGCPSSDKMELISV